MPAHNRLILPSVELAVTPATRLVPLCFRVDLRLVVIVPYQTERASEVDALLPPGMRHQRRRPPPRRLPPKLPLMELKSRVRISPKPRARC